MAVGNMSDMSKPVTCALGCSVAISYYYVFIIIPHPTSHIVSFFLFPRFTITQDPDPQPISRILASCGKLCSTNGNMLLGKETLCMVNKAGFPAWKTQGQTLPREQCFDCEMFLLGMMGVRASVRVCCSSSTERERHVLSLSGLVPLRPEVNNTN